MCCNFRGSREKTYTEGMCGGIVMLFMEGEMFYYISAFILHAFVSRSVPILTVLEYPKPCVSVQSCAVYCAACVLVTFHTSRYSNTDNMPFAIFCQNMLRR